MLRRILLSALVALVLWAFLSRAQNFTIQSKPFSGYYTVIGFDASGKLFLPFEYGSGDGTVPYEEVGKEKFFYQWEVCQTYWDFYNWTTLTWRTGGEAINPTCKPVNVTREWV
ncbi:hypothetical protein QBC40DRAFT_250021 [Triangularia verruculosa]|uniref:WG repeat-containing protein n=1 Tax=Triangularia verruculosa TaxID=2587418 RepID=A0AAN7AX50_9PEZI|nr:hypothetical protein QBC40DRAFT_250021 [Triangularia verruculosa]